MINSSFTKLTINQMLFVSHIVLVLTVIAGLSYSRFNSEWERHIRYSALLAKQAFENQVKFVSGAVAGVNYAKLVMPSTKQTLDSVEDLMFLEIKGISDYSERGVHVRYSRKEDALWRSDVTKNEISKLKQRVDSLRLRADSGDIDSAVTKKKLTYLLNRSMGELKVLSESMALRSMFHLPWEKPDQVANKYFFDPDDCILHIVIPLTNANGGYMWAVIDAAKLTQIQHSLLQELLLEALLALAVSIALIWWVTHWVVSPIKNLADSMNSENAYKNINKLAELKRTDEIGQLARAYRELLNKIEAQLNSLRSKSDTDPLTGLGSRYKYTRKALPFIKWNLAKGDYLGLIVCDVDNFKAFNDCYGHSEGDIALAKIGQVITDVTQDTDLAFRYGGEEFVILCARSSLEQLYQFTERLRENIESLDITHSGNQPYGCLTLSMGGAATSNKGYITSQIDHQELQNTLFNMADKALYVSKKQGRNIVQWRTFNEKGSVAEA